ncbi:CPBP family intramembrane metalloprotease [Actinoplanes sp. NBC_00393]|uniref:CPBP family intramembrane glutamic endopeptidase n=1 Tax=Actinoplanes sp. NBC_00393 TaxID=2975953 RepID=UPI002E1E49CA
MPGMIALSIGFLVLVRIWNYAGPAWAQPVTGPAAAALLVLLTGVAPGLTFAGWEYALAGVIAVAVGYGLAVVIPPARGALAAAEFRRPAYTALVAVPLATVTFEEVAFRGVLWTLIARDHGPLWATGTTAVIFGLWHLSPDSGTRENLGTVAFTTLAGVALGELRHLSGGLLAPIAVHWAANGLGVLAATAVPGAPREQRRGAGPTP